MANATVVRAWTDAQQAYVAVSVAEGGAQGTVEYVGVVSLIFDLASVGFAGQTWTQLSAPNKKAALVTAVKAVRDTQQLAQAVIAGISGSVVI